jgi:hypothetical protein
LIETLRQARRHTEPTIAPASIDKVCGQGATPAMMNVTIAERIMRPTSAIFTPFIALIPHAEQVFEISKV